MLQLDTDSSNMVEYFPIKRINIHIDGTLLELVSWREFNFGICQQSISNWTKQNTSAIILKFEIGMHAPSKTYELSQ